MYEKVILVGRLGNDPEMRYTQDGKPVTSFSLAVDVGFGEKKATHWYRVSVFDKQAESCNQYLHKGSIALVEGRMQADETGSPRIWTDKEGKARASFEVTAQAVRFLSGKPEAEEAEF